MPAHQENIIVHQTELALEMAAAFELLPSEIEIKAIREGGLVDANVPLNLIDLIEVPVDEDHVATLADSMLDERKVRGGTGQNHAISVAQIIGEPQFPIMDGFHRATGRNDHGLPDVYATIRLNSTWEEVYDRRILAASTHRAVRFARVIEWVEEVWRISPWAEQF